jgi:hypothetical protein
MDINKEREAFESWWESFHNGRQIACDYVEENNSYSVGYANAQWVAWQAAKAQAVPAEFEIGRLKDQITELLDERQDLYAQINAQAVPESRTDFEIIDQTIQLVDLLANSNRFQRDKSKPFPFESENPRNMEWWRLACHIQELLTDTDPNNCDFEEYKAMIETQEQSYV